MEKIWAKMAKIWTKMDGNGTPLSNPPPSGRGLGGRCSDAHATGDAQGGQNSRQNGDYRLDDEFPSFFFHGIRLG